MMIPSLGACSVPSWKDLPTRPNLLSLGPEEVDISESAFQIFGNNISERFWSRVKNKSEGFYSKFGYGVAT